MLFQAGQSGNPKGRPRAYQGFVERAKCILETRTRGELLALAADKAAMDKLSLYDSIVIPRILEAMEVNGSQSMNSLLDRIIGKPVQPVAQKIEHSIEQGTLAAMQAMRSLPQESLLAISNILEEAQTMVIDKDAESE